MALAIRIGLHFGANMPVGKTRLSLVLRIDLKYDIGDGFGMKPFFA